MRRVRKLVRNFTRVLIASVIGCVVLGVPAKAYAGTNGQQVIFNGSWGLCGNNTHIGQVYVFGQNQDGRWALWSGRANDGTWIFTQGWWWKGSITIWWYQYGILHTTTAWVPSGSGAGDSRWLQYNPNAVVVDCDGSALFWTATIRDTVHYTAGRGFDGGCIQPGDPAGEADFYTNYYGYSPVDGYGHIDGQAIGMGGMQVPYVPIFHFETDECELLGPVG